MILAGDVGGTKTNLGLFERDGDRLVLRRNETLRSSDYPGLEALLAQFLGAEKPRLEAACFGIPGPVVAGRVRTANLSWEVDADSVVQATGIPKVLLVNDLLATAEGIAALGPEELATLQPGSPPAEPGAVALVAPGTGLGMSILARVGSELMPQPSEGGHMDFAARNDEEYGLLRFLQARYGRVSVERILSGPGLVNLYEYLRDVERAPESPQIRDEMKTQDAGGVIGRAGLSGEDPLCVHALDLFVSLLGATAGNLALLSLSTGGVFLGGGIPPKILPKLREPLFLNAFRDKGRWSGLLETFPIHVILNQGTGLLGAARRAARLAQSA